MGDCNSQIHMARYCDLQQIMHLPFSKVRLLWGKKPCQQADLMEKLDVHDIPEFPAVPRKLRWTTAEELE